MSQQIIVDAHGARIPALGLGTFRSEGQACVEAVATALKVGYRHIDTAAMYGNEAEVGEGLRAGGVPRDEVFVTTKVWWSEIGSGALQRSAEASLEAARARRGRPPADPLAQPGHPARRTRSRRSATPSAAASPATSACRTSRWRSWTRPCGSPPSRWRRCNASITPRSGSTGCWRPSGATAWRSPPTRRSARGPTRRTKTVQEIAVAHGKTGAQTVLRWHVQQAGVCAIPKSSHPGRIAENFDIWDFSLSPDEMAAISRLARADGRMINPGLRPDLGRVTREAAASAPCPPRLAARPAVTLSAAFSRDTRHEARR